jgi:uncharacterized protein (DUF2141 family)
MVFVILLMIAGPDVLFAQEYSLTVNVGGLRSEAGKLYLSLYRSAEGFPQKASAAYRLAFGTIEKGKCRIVLDKLPPGVYAVACYHDENNNGKIDTNFFGIPKEGTGASRDAKGSMGPPKFADAKFGIERDTTIEIRIHY